MLDQSEDLHLIFEKMVEFRTHFHTYPELSMEEFKTAQYIRDHLKEAGFTEIYELAGTGTVAIIRGELNESILIRGDIDALPVSESDQHKVRSSVKGVSHACGHDIHAAVLLGTAIYTMEQVKSGKHKLKRGIKFCFQPGEESGNNGARQMIEDTKNYNLLDSEPRVVVCTGLHVTTALHTGQVGYQKGAFTGSSDKFEINITGTGGHAMCPSDTVDGIQIGVQLCNAIYQIRGRNVSQNNPITISIGMFQAGSRPNVIEATCKIQGGIRAMNASDREIALLKIEHCCKAMEVLHGAKVEFINLGGYRGIVNHESLEKKVKSVLNNIVGSDNVIATNMGMAGEDFYNFSEARPSAFWILGGGPELEEEELTSNQMFQNIIPQNTEHKHHAHVFTALKNTHHSAAFEINNKSMLIALKVWREFIFGSQKKD